jgi:hypothetical protein
MSGSIEHTMCSSACLHPALSFIVPRAQFRTSPLRISSVPVWTRVISSLVARAASSSTVCARRCTSRTWRPRTCSRSSHKRYSPESIETACQDGERSYTSSHRMESSRDNSSRERIKRDAEHTASHTPPLSNCPIIVIYSTKRVSQANTSNSIQLRITIRAITLGLSASGVRIREPSNSANRDACARSEQELEREIVLQLILVHVFD